MKLKVLSLTAILTILSSTFVFGQTSTGARSFEPDTTGEAKINQVLADAGKFFKEGLLSLQDNRRSIARGKFDEAVEVFLMSNINVKSNAALNNCYNQMLETIYRIEFPSVQIPQIQSLATNCGWNVDGQLANAVINISRTKPSETANASTEGTPGINQVAFNQVGFSEQVFESNGDELAQLPPELTQEEITSVETPEQRQEYEKIQYAVQNKSFGFYFRMHPMVQQYVNYYRGRGRATMETGLARSGMFTRMARKIFREEGLPENIVWLGQVESAWKPVAKSWAAASGLWQFIPGTGIRYGLRQNAYVDERNSFEKATRASAQYLKFLANRYNGNWELAMAAYNCGEGNTDRAIRRAGVSDYWAAYPYLPKETRNYVPNILAVILIANNPNAYGFGHIRPLPPLQYELLRVPPMTSLATVAQLANTSTEYIRYLNPEFRGNTTPPEPYVIRVPQGKGEAVAQVMRKMPGGRNNNLAVSTVMKGESAQNIANRTGVDVKQVQVVGDKAIIKQDSMVKTTSYSSPRNASPNQPTKGPQIVTVKSGDTVAKIAARFGVAAVDVARLNGLTSIDAPLAVGRQIRVQVK